MTNAMPGCAVSYQLSPARSPAQPKGDVISVAPRRFSDVCRGAIVFIVVAASLFWSPPTLTAEPSDIESNLTITIGGAAKQVSLAEAMAALNIPAASIALSIRTKSHSHVPTAMAWLPTASFRRRLRRNS